MTVKNICAGAAQQHFSAAGAVVLVVLVLAWPVYRSGRYLMRFTERSTNVLARASG